MNGSPGATNEAGAGIGLPARDDEWAVIIDSDSPHLPVETATDAFRQREHHDLVIGPVHAGGY